MDTQVRTDVIRRLHCAEGHLYAVIRMVQEDCSCLAVVQQTQAVRGALHRVNALLLAHHVDVCLRRVWDEKDEDEYRRFRDELLALVVRRE